MVEEKQFILRGFGAGALAGLIAFVFARIFAEPQVQKAIDYENARDSAQNALDRAAHVAVAPEGHELFSRSIQQNVGAGVGLILFGLAVGGFFSVGYVLIARRYPHVRPRVMALIVAGLGFAALYAVPFLKYPANPPSIGHEETIRARSELYTAMVVISVVAIVGAYMLARRLAPQLGSWNAVLLSLLTFAAAIGVAMLILPAIGHLHANVAEYGRHDTETPLPLTDAHGHIVFPGFPADVLFKFRLYSFLNQMILWGGIGLIFGALTERLMASHGVRYEQSRPHSQLFAAAL